MLLQDVWYLEKLANFDREVIPERRMHAKGSGAFGTFTVTGDISNLTDPENLYERQQWSHLLEIYMPIRASRSSLIIAVAELYQRPDDLEAQVNNDRLTAWALVAIAALLAYLALARVVSQGSKRIISQDSELRERVRQLSALLEQNAGLHDRLRRAAERTTALNELERRRIGSDLHDGPTQTLAFAMLVGRFVVIVPVLAIAGSLGAKTPIPPSVGTFATNNTTFVVLLIITIIILAGLNFFPALTLGPVLEHFLMLKGMVF